MTISNHDFIILVDFSGSMASVDAGHKDSRIQRVKESLTGLVSELAAVDSDGIEVITFAGSGASGVTLYSGVNNASVVETIFNSRRVAGGTPTAEALAKAFEVTGKSDKPDFIVVFTDGEPNDRAAVRDVITKQVNAQANDEDLTVLFIQVGNDTSAGQFLASLDDDLRGIKFDIVDVKTQEEADSFPTLAALIEAAING